MHIPNGGSANTRNLLIYRRKASRHPSRPMVSCISAHQPLSCLFWLRNSHVQVPEMYAFRTCKVRTRHRIISCSKTQIPVDTYCISLDLCVCVSYDTSATPFPGPLQDSIIIIMSTSSRRAPRQIKTKIRSRGYTAPFHPPIPR